MCEGVCVCLASSLDVSAYMRKQLECAHRRKAERERELRLESFWCAALVVAVLCTLSLDLSLLFPLNEASSYSGLSDQ